MRNCLFLKAKGNCYTGQNYRNKAFIYHKSVIYEKATDCILFLNIEFQAKYIAFMEKLFNFR